MRKNILFFLFLFLVPLYASAQEAQKRILFRSDSAWYAAQEHLLFASTDKGISWDTIFAKNSTDTVFFNGRLDTATNVFISDAQTLFVFGWDGTMHYITIVYASTDGGKTWNKNRITGNSGTIGVKYLHKINAAQFFLDCRMGHYYLTLDGGKTWALHMMVGEKYSSADERFTFDKNGDITYEYRKGKKIKKLSKDGGKTWKTVQD